MLSKLTKLVRKLRFKEKTGMILKKKRKRNWYGFPNTGR
jgi:hypothetical protein